MSAIYDEFWALITSRPNFSARGFTNIDCPACGDRRKRGGFAPTPTGGFRYYCYNGGCEYHDKATGWEPGNGLFGRVRKLFEYLGGNIYRIPLVERIPQNQHRPIFDQHGNVVGQQAELETVTKFISKPLPGNSLPLIEAAEKNTRAKAVLDYLRSRGAFYPEVYPFKWTPEHPSYLIIPYLYFNDIIGFSGRNIKPKSHGDRFIQSVAEDYLFNQHLLYQDIGEYVFVMESPLDAIAVNGLSTRGSKFTQKQINLLRVSGKKPVLVPERNGEESGHYLEMAEANEWPVTVPGRDVWGSKKIKDIGESVQHNGLLLTLEGLVSGITQNYIKAKALLETFSNAG